MRSTLVASAPFIFSIAAALPSTGFGAIEARGAPFNDFGDHTGSTSRWNTETDGHYVKSGDGHTYASGVKCWTDLMFVYNEEVAVQWSKTDQEIDCGGSSNPDKNICTSNQAVTSQSCTTHTNGGTVEPGLELNVAIGLADFAETKGGLKLGGSYIHLDANQQCSTSSTTNSCGWGDDQCHAIWVSNVSNRVHGFVRRRCDFHDGKGDQTVWSFDQDYDLPTKTVRLGCDASCSATSYPGAVPPI